MMLDRDIIGNLITVSNEKNNAGNDYEFYGINKNKEFMPTVASTDNLDKNKFYRNHPDAKKLLDVNSHSIDDLEADLNGKSEDEIKSIFKSLFVDNEFGNHFNAYWPS